MKTSNLIGAVLASFGFLVVIFAGTLGQLFTVSGATKHIPAYGTAAIQNGWDIGYADPLTYDEAGHLIDFTKIPGRIGTKQSGTACQDATYAYELKDLKVWKKGSAITAIMTSFHSAIDPVLETCAVPPGQEFSCGSGCMQSGKDEIIAAKPLDLVLNAADAVSIGILQYVLTANAVCIRVRHCVTAGS